MTQGRRRSTLASLFSARLSYPGRARILLNCLAKTLCSEGGGALDNPGLPAVRATEMQGIRVSAPFLQLAEASGALEVEKIDVEIKSTIQIVFKRDDIHGSSPVA